MKRARRNFLRLAAGAVAFPEGRTPRVLADLVGSEVAKWVTLLRAAGVVAD
jgi:hypothetical protein